MVRFTDLDFGTQSLSVKNNRTNMISQLAFNISLLDNIRILYLKETLFPWYVEVLSLGQLLSSTRAKKTPEEVLLVFPFTAKKSTAKCYQILWSWSAWKAGRLKEFQLNPGQATPKTAPLTVYLLSIHFQVNRRIYWYISQTDVTWEIFLQDSILLA